MGEVPESGPEPILHEEADQVMVTDIYRWSHHTHDVCPRGHGTGLATGVCGTGRGRGWAALPHEDQDTLSTALVTSL